MRLNYILYEDFTNYKKASMYLSVCFCDFKCCKESNLPISTCQNSEICNSKQVYIPDDVIYERYIKSTISESIIFCGLEPFLQFEEMYNLIKYFRDKGCEDDFVIYSGYYKDEIIDKLELLKDFNNIIVKFGRYIPNRSSRYDEVLGVTLISDNQYAERIS